MTDAGKVNSTLVEQSIRARGMIAGGSNRSSRNCAFGTEVDRVCGRAGSIAVSRRAAVGLAAGGRRSTAGLGRRRVRQVASQRGATGTASDRVRGDQRARVAAAIVEE